MENECETYINKLVEEYRQTHIFQQERDLLISENNIEKRDIKGYHGREILELLQNADDAYQKSIMNGCKPDEELEVSISYIDDVLTVVNTGTFFDKDGIKAIVQGNNSPKSGKYIGSKGTGFRSILNWAKSVKILSGNFNVEFSQSIAQDFFESIKKEPQIEKQLNKNKNLYIPMLAVPKIIEPNKFNNLTSIQIEIDKDKQGDDFSVLKQLSTIDLHSLLFLPNIAKIKIKTSDQEIEYIREFEKSDTNFKKVTVKKCVANKLEAEEHFSLFEKKIPEAIKEGEVLKDVAIAIAVPSDFSNFHASCIYSFFPLLDSDSFFNCIIHGTYILGDHRNSLSFCDENKTIIKEQMKFIVDIAKNYIQRKDYETAYKLIIPSLFNRNGLNFPGQISRYGLDDFYISALYEEKLFETVNKDVISIKDNPKVLKNYPTSIKGSSFNLLLKPFNEETIVDFIDFVAKKKEINIFYSESELVKNINSCTEKWTIKEQIEVYIWFEQMYAKQCSILPNLIKTTENQYLNINDECYLLDGNFDDLNIPSWVKIPSIQSDYQQELFNQTETLEKYRIIKETDKERTVSRIICQEKLYNLIKFNYRDRSTIIPTVNSSVESYDESVEFLQWLWKYYGKEEDWTPPGRGKNEQQPTKYNFPSKNKNVIPSDLLFLGDDYCNNTLSSKLFDKSMEPFQSLDQIQISVDDISQFMFFIRKFGVKKYPEIRVQKIVPFPKYKEKYEKIIINNGYIGSSAFLEVIEFNLPYITNIPNLLNNLTTMEIIEWIYNDTALQTNLCSSQSTDAEIKYKGSKQVYPRNLSESCSLDNYILAIFNEMKWITIEEKKYAPKEILQSFNDDGRNNEKFKDWLAVLTSEDLKTLANNLNLEFGKIKNIFSLFSFCNDIFDLSSADFYKLMNKIPNDGESTFELSKSIYYQITEKKIKDSVFEDSSEKDEFMKNGKVLVNFKGQLMYYPASKTFLPSIRIFDKKNTPIIAKGMRSNNEIFKTLFGCLEYNVKYSIDTESLCISPANDSFQAYFKDFLTFAKAYRKNENIYKYINTLKITLISEISIVENENKKRITDGDGFFRNTISDWFIMNPSSTFPINEISEKIESIFSNIANTPGFDSGKIGELFRTKDNSDREFLIKKEFGSLSILDGEYKNSIFNNFKDTVKKINPELIDCENTGIDFENFSDINNIPLIIDFFKNLNVDIADFKANGFVYNIDLIQYYRKQLSDFILENKRLFKNALFSYALENESVQSKFIEKFESFENFLSIIEYQNSVYFDVKQKAIAFFNNVLNDWEKMEPSKQADDAYSENYEKLNPNKLYEDDISNDLEAQRMIYFNKTDEFNSWLEKKKRKNDINSDLDDSYSELENIIPSETKIKYSNLGTSEDVKERGTIRTGTITRTFIERKQQKQKILGNKGELLVYNYLCNQYGKDNIYPRSEAFVDLKIIKPGQAKSSYYDISYFDEGKEYFVEVKTGNSNSFFISPDELGFAKNNHEKYKLFVVHNIDSKEPKFTIMPDQFWENNKFRKTEVIETIKFDF